MKIVTQILISCVMLGCFGMANADVLVTPKGTIVNKENIFNEIENTELKKLPETQAIKTLYKVTEEFLGSNPSDKQIEEFLKIAAEENNKRLPEDLGDGVVAKRVIAYKKTMVYSYDVQGVDLSVVPRNVLKSMLIKEERICETLGFLIKYGVTIVFEYRQDNGKVLKINFTPKDCSF